MAKEQTPEEREAALEKREQALRADRMRFEIAQALAGSNCRQEALQDATAMMAGACEVELDDDGRIAKLSLAGNEYDTPAAAAEAFLASREYLVWRAEAEPESKSTPARVQNHEKTVADAWTRPRVAPAPAPAKVKIPSGNLEDILKSGYSAADLASEGWANPPK